MQQTIWPQEPHEGHFWSYSKEKEKTTDSKKKKKKKRPLQSRHFQLVEELLWQLVSSLQNPSSLVI